MATTARSEPIESQELLLGHPQVHESKESSLTVFPAHKQEAEGEMEQPVHKRAPMWDAGRKLHLLYHGTSLNKHLK